MIDQVEFTLEYILENIASIAIIVFEFMGIAIIIWTGAKGFYKFLKHSTDTGIYLAKGLAMGLEFKMGSEILRTVIVREWKEISIVAGIIALRAALSFLLHWEIKQESKSSLAENQALEESHPDHEKSETQKENN